jgi:hypothetical protein
MWHVAYTGLVIREYLRIVNLKAARATLVVPVVILFAKDFLRLPQQRNQLAGTE